MQTITNTKKPMMIISASGLLGMTLKAHKVELLNDLKDDVSIVQFWKSHLSLDIKLSSFRVSFVVVFNVLLLLAS